MFFLLHLGLIRKHLLNGFIKQYSASELGELIRKRNNVLLLDVRSIQERVGNMIMQSAHIPAQELISMIKELEKYRSMEIVCYCRAGNRSLSTASKLMKFGFNAANLKGGIIKW